MKCLFRASVFILFCLQVLTCFCEGKTFYVRADDPNDPGTGSSTDPFVRIQDGIDAATDGDVVLVHPGVYHGDGNINLNPSGKSIMIRSIDPLDPSIVKSTVIDASGGMEQRGFYIVNGEDPNCIISGFTIRNGRSSAGSGIVCINNSSPTISYCIIRDNISTTDGGGILFINSHSTVSHCQILGNHAAGSGGGILIFDGHVKIVNSIIAGNSSENGGGGLIQGPTGKTSVINCTIGGNQSPVGGGILNHGETEITNSILWLNIAAKGGQLALASPINPSRVTIGYSDIQGGEEEVAYDPNTNTLNWSSTNIAVNPEFVLFDNLGDPNVWDFHLQSVYGRWNPGLGTFVKDAITSECIDSGDPTLDYKEEKWPHGLRINMGAYGGMDQASKNGNPADFDINGIVDIRDFVLFSTKWMGVGKHIEDLDGNQSVDDPDLILFSGNWLWQETE